MKERFLRHRQMVTLLVVCVGLALGGLARLAGNTSIADGAWLVATVVALVPLSVSLIRDLLRRRLGVDIVAMLALAGALILAEYLVGAVIAVMYAGGQALESYAGSRAERELKALLARAPRLAHRYEDGHIRAIPATEVRPGDVLLVTAGEVIPADGLVAGGAAVLDESALTGEARLVEHQPGDRIRSGAVNASAPFDLRATASAEESTYAGIVRLVQQAQTSKAPFVRLANRYALAFVPLTLVVSGLAWALSGQFVRALAVLVVATPCPLILAAPVAIVSGISRAARRGIIVKDGGALETLGRARVLVLDKTGTLTAGQPALKEVVAPNFPAGELVRIAASVDQVSQHVLADAIVRAAGERGTTLSFPTDANEVMGRGIIATVDGRRVAVGRADWVDQSPVLPSWLRAVRRRTSFEGLASVFVAVDGLLVGALLLDDPLRADSPRTLKRLRRAGIDRIVMATGDRAEVAATVGAVLGLDEVRAERSPSEKVEVVRAERAHAVTVMVGDGVNDAPALAAADVGVAMGARGSTASSEAADIVLVVDRIERLAEAIDIGHRSRRIALQSVLAGMGLSLVAMVFAAAGAIPPVLGAALQEAIDVAVILNALRALGGGPRLQRERTLAGVDGARVHQEHRGITPIVDRLRGVADRLDELPPAAALAELRDMHTTLVTQLLPHEAKEEAFMFPLVGQMGDGVDATDALRRTHVEIGHLTALLGTLVRESPSDGIDVADLSEYRRVLYGLYALLRLHIAQEDENVFSLFDEVAEPVPALTASAV